MDLCEKRFVKNLNVKMKIINYYVECDKTAHRLERLYIVKEFVHVNFEIAETENIVHVHENLSFKSTVRA